MTSSHRLAGLLAACLLATSGAASRAAELEDVTIKLRSAREKYTEMGQYLVLYAAKSELAQTAHALQAQRDQQATYIRMLRVQLDGFPARRNSIQQGVHQEWLQARNVLIDLDRQIAAIQADSREVDEQALALTATNRRRVLPQNRRGIQGIFPVIREECASSFRSLQDAADGYAKAQDITRDVVIDRAMAMLGRKEVVEAQYGPTKLFLADFKKFCNSHRLADTPSPRGRR